MPFRLSGENIAFDQSVEGAHQAFMDSPGHRRNVLDGDFTHVGIGIITDGRGSMYVTQHFMRPRPGYVATTPPRRSPSAAEAGSEPRLAETHPSPHPCDRCDAPADGAGTVAGAGEAPMLQPPPYFGAPPAQVPVAPATPTEVWVVTPGGGWYPVATPWAPPPQYVLAP